MFSMNRFQRFRMLKMSGLIAIIAIALSLILFALKQNINLYLTPSEVHQKYTDLQDQKIFRLGGLVVGGSHKENENLAHEFVLTDGIKEIKVYYKGLLPDLFKEKQGIVTQGHLKNEHVFIAEQVLAKHDENYHPPGVPKEAVV